MLRKERYKRLIAHFTENFPDPETELRYENPFQLLVAVILSAQCTDKRINMITPALFEAYPDAARMAEASFEELFPYIKSVSYPNNKTRHLIAMAQKLVEDYQGELPHSVEELQKLQGVGRKTANVVVSVLYNQPAMAVDTHVFRVSKRLGLVNQNASTPLAVEKQLTQHLPKDLIAKAHHWLILHGRYVCTARQPKCSTCELWAICRYFEKNEKAKEKKASQK